MASTSTAPPSAVAAKETHTKEAAQLYAAARQHALLLITQIEQAILTEDTNEEEDEEEVHLGGEHLAEEEDDDDDTEEEEEEEEDSEEPLSKARKDNKGKRSAPASNISGDEEVEDSDSEDEDEDEDEDTEALSLSLLESSLEKFESTLNLPPATDSLAPVDVPADSGCEQTYVLYARCLLDTALLSSFQGYVARAIAVLDALLATTTTSDSNTMKEARAVVATALLRSVLADANVAQDDLEQIMDDESSGEDTIESAREGVRTVVSRSGLLPVAERALTGGPMSAEGADSVVAAALPIAARLREVAFPPDVASLLSLVDTTAAPSASHPRAAHARLNLAMAHTYAEDASSEESCSKAHSICTKLVQDALPVPVDTTSDEDNTVVEIAAHAHVVLGLLVGMVPSDTKEEDDDDARALKHFTQARKLASRLPYSVPALDRLPL